jgi:replicative DNA helicase
MAELRPTTEPKPTWLRENLGPASVSDVMHEVEEQAARGAMNQFRPMATGFEPLDTILNGGLRPGELAVVGGPHGVGKTIFGLQMARNVVYEQPKNRALYVCYEHDRAHLLSRLLCMESAEQGMGEGMLTLRKLSKLVESPYGSQGMISALRSNRRYRDLMATIDGYADRLVLARASGAYTTMQEIQRWIDEVLTDDVEQLLVVVDYLQKVPVSGDLFQNEDELTTHLTHGFKEMALARNVPILAIVASDRRGLQSKRMRISDMRGSSAVQYEADVGLVLNNKYHIVSREHLIYSLADAESMRNWVVMTVEKNRAGRHAVAPHFRILSTGDFVRERLIDGKAVLE